MKSTGRLTYTNTPTTITHKITYNHTATANNNSLCYASMIERKCALKSIKQGNLKIELMNGKRAKTAWNFYRCIECFTYWFNLFNLTLTRCILEQANESSLWWDPHSYSASAGWFTFIYSSESYIKFSITKLCRAIFVFFSPLYPFQLKFPFDMFRIQQKT